MLKSLRNIFNAAHVRTSERYLLIIVTDGQPNDGATEESSIDELKSLLYRKPGNLLVSMVECSDQPEEMEYLETWNNQIPGFDNTEDFPEEVKRIRTIQGNPNYKFTYTDYVIKVLLATLNREYFSVDMYRTGKIQPRIVPPDAYVYSQPPTATQVQRQYVAPTGYNDQPADGCCIIS